MGPVTASVAVPTWLPTPDRQHLASMWELLPSNSRVCGLVAVPWIPSCAEGDLGAAVGW